MSTQEKTGATNDSAEHRYSRDITVGKNGVPVAKAKTSGGGYRTYEIHQRMRPGETTSKMKPNRLISDEYLTNPYAPLEVLRENYPCYRDWITNVYWVTQYNDVTSVFVDDANFETRPKSWFYSIEGFGRDLRGEIPVLTAQAGRIDANAGAIAEKIINEMVAAGEADLALDFAARYPMELLGCVLDLPEADMPKFIERYWHMQRGYHWEPRSEQAGKTAIEELTAYFQPLVEARRANPGDDMVSAIAGLELDGGPATGADVVATLLESDHETLHGGFANMWYQLLTNPDQLQAIKDDRRFIKFAWFETLRHSTPIINSPRFAKHEVERFGLILPEGATVNCSAAAANRDPRIYTDADKFDVKRKDMCQREPRGMYRADGLPAGIAFGLGAPTKHPAVPEDRPRSIYAITRDVVVIASNILLDKMPNIRLQDGATPDMRSLRIGEMHTCWHLPISF
jgi:cytochrome P450